MINMNQLEEIRNERIKKLEVLREKGINSYPLSVCRDFSAAEILDNFPKLLKRKKPFFSAGRVIAVRAHGGAIFFDLRDNDVSVQAYIKKDEVGAEQFALFSETVDIGDFVELEGGVFITKKKEKTIKVSSWRMLAKSVNPLPSKWHGLQDIEERFRKRYLDLLMNDEVKNRFLKRSQIISEIRAYLNKEEFLEVETPMLQHLAGGALAEPFKTHHNVLDMDLFLRVAPELYLKKLLIGGFTKIYEIGKNFRNEGVDVTHNPEFTMLELYESYKDADYLMDFTERFLTALVKKINGKAEIKYGENKISFDKGFKRISYYNLLKKFTLIAEPDKADREEYALKAKQLGIKVEDFEDRTKIMDNIFKKICRPKLIEPTFIIDYPVNVSPLAKRKEGEPSLIDRFQLAIGGIEMVNGFSELNDPFDQRARFAEQDKMKEKGEKEVSPSDEDYLEAMEYGMPPSAGLGIGVDRLVMLLTDTHNIKEVILFPTMRPKTE